MIKVLDPYELVRSHPERYWGGNRSPNAEQVNRAVVDQIESDGFSDIETHNFHDWQVLCCDPAWANWIGDHFGGIARVFEDAVGQPTAAAPNELRVEWFLRVLAESTVVFVQGLVAFATGEIDLTLQDEVQQRFRDKVCICYRLPRAAT